MFSKISERIFFKVLNAPTISSKAVCLRSLSSSNNIDDPLMRSVDLLQRKQRKTPSSVFNPAEANLLNILTEQEKLMASFPDVLQDISELVEKSCKDKDFVDRIIRAVNSNVPNGNQVYGLSLIMTHLTLVDTAQLTPDNMKMIRRLAWILEMIIASATITDDIVDGGTIRRDQPCWHLVEDVKLTALNDVSVIESLAYCLLKKYFSHSPCYLKLFEQFHESTLAVSIGQQAEFWFGRKGVQHFTMDNYIKASYAKTGGTARLPFALATKFIGIDTPELYRQTDPILLEIGLFKQIQNDFNGCFFDSDHCAKITPETESGQLSWLAVKCMELATPAQRKMMIECFGKHDSEKAMLVKQLYEDLNLPQLYHQLEDETYDKLAASIKNLSCGKNVNVAMLNFLNICFKYGDAHFTV